MRGSGNAFVNEDTFFFACIVLNFIDCSAKKKILFLIWLHISISCFGSLCSDMSRYQQASRK